MRISDDAVEFLSGHLTLLPEDKRPLAQYICDSWPLQKRLPRRWARESARLFGFRVDSLESSYRATRELFMIAASLHRAGGGEDS